MSAHTAGLTELAAGRHDRTVRLTGSGRFTPGHAADVASLERPEPGPVPHPSAIGGEPSRRGFVAMLEGYRSSGGTVSGNSLGQLLKECQRGTFVQLARLIAQRRVFTFEWHGESWIPMFQFDSADLSCKEGPGQVRNELDHLPSSWAVAAWFALPNALLQGRRPADAIDNDLPGVLAAARGLAPVQISGCPPLAHR